MFTGVAPGTYAVSVKNASGCISASSIAVVNVQPVLPAAPSLTIIQPTCELSTGTISVSSPLNVGNTYSINGVDYSNTSGIFSGVMAGTYNVSVRNAVGCIGSATVAVINANPLTPPAPTVEVVNPVCPERTGSIRVVSQGTGNTYSIDGSTYINTTGVFTSVVPGTYRVSVKNAGGCVSGSVVVVVKDPVVDEAKLVITASGSTSICEGSSVVLTSGVSTSYQWYKYGVAIAGANARTYSASSEGIYTVSRVSVGGCAAVQSDGIEVKVLSVPMSPVVVVSQPTCEISTGSITVTSPIVAGNTYSIDGSTYTNTTGVFTNLVSGTYIATIKNINGCVSAGTSFVINQHPLTPPTPTIEVINPTCPDKNGSIRVKSPIGNSISYSIDGTNYYRNSGFFNSVPAGTYDVTVKNLNGCVSVPVTAIIKEPVIEDLKLTITASGSTNICEESSVVLTSSESSTYQWYKSGIAISGANSKTFTASTEGVYTVSKLRSGSCQTVQSDGIIIKVISKPVSPLVTANKLFFCEGDSVELNATSDFKISWYKDGINISQTSKRQIAKQGGTYNAIAVNDNGCKSSFSESVVLKMLDIPVSPTLSIIGSRQFCKDESRLIKVSIPTGMKISWYKNGTLISNYHLDTLRVSEAAEFTAKFENTNNCFSLVSNKIITEIVCNSTGIYIPDVFSPNSDGINDIVKPVCVGISSFSYFKIYNRWGNILFETKDPSIGWDGKFRGQNQPADTYIWLVEGIDTNGKEIRKTGTLNLIR